MNNDKKMWHGPYQDNHRPSCCNCYTYNNNGLYNSESNNKPSNSNGPYRNGNERNRCHCHSRRVGNLKDIYGNYVLSSTHYYMQPLNFPDQGMGKADWGDGEWLKLEPGLGAVTVRFEAYGSHVKMRTNQVILYSTQWGGILEIPLYLTGEENGVSLKISQSEEQNPVEFYKQLFFPIESGDYNGFRIYPTSKLLSYRGRNEWLYVDNAHMNDNTKWRLIPKQQNRYNHLQKNYSAISHLDF